MNLWMMEENVEMNENELKLELLMKKNFEDMDYSMNALKTVLFYRKLF
jgi:hypothetical protein